MLNEFLFTKLKRKILATFGFNRTALRATQPKLHSMFCALFLNNSFGHLGAARPLDYYLWGAVKDKCYADKPEKMDALKDNEAIAEIQLHPIDNVFKIAPIV